MRPRLEIRSFRSVFALERRIYRIDTLRLNPSGVPLRGIAYALALIIVAVLAATVPPASWLAPALPWYVRDLGLPVAASFVLGSLRLDGRPFHLAACAALAHASASIRRAARAARPRRWRPPPVVWVPDGSDAQFRRVRYRGPGAVLVLRPHERVDRSRWARAAVALRPRTEGAARPTVIELAAGATLEVRDR
ncbi:MAG: hypothetical protein ACRDLP_05685 [Solirubrobacteraceae bacterium]